jgi:hypothetical protein
MVGPPGLEPGGVGWGSLLGFLSLTVLSDTVLGIRHAHVHLVTNGSTTYRLQGGLLLLLFFLSVRINQKLIAEKITREHIRTLSIHYQSYAH